MSGFLIGSRADLPARIRQAGSRCGLVLAKDPDDRFKPDFEAPYLRLDMEDVTDPSHRHAPAMQHVARAHRFVAEHHGPMVFSCFGGLYRSPALALLYPLTHMAAEPKEAVEIVWRVHPESICNDLIVALIDERLDLNGALIRAVETKRPRIFNFVPEVA